MTLEDLWLEYKTTFRLEYRNALIEHYLPFVRRVAASLSKQVDEEVDDLAAEGVFGLIRAIERFDILRGGEFEAFAFSRVQGAMIDECRKHTVVSRHYRAMVKKMDRAREVLTRELGREPSHDEVCDRAGVTGQSRESVVRHSREPEFVPVSEEVVREEFSNLSTDLEEVESLLRFLDEEDQMVIRLEWVEGRSATAVQKILRIPTDDIAGVRQRAMANFIQCWRERYSKREGVCCVAS